DLDALIAERLQAGLDALDGCIADTSRRSFDQIGAGRSLGQRRRAAHRTWCRAKLRQKLIVDLRRDAQPDHLAIALDRATGLRPCQSVYLAIVKLELRKYALDVLHDGIAL